MKRLYKKKGQASATNAMVFLIVGVGIAVIMVILMGVLAGQTYQLTEGSVQELTTAVTGESLTVLNSTEVFLANDNLVTGSVAVSNATGTVIPLDNFVIDLGAGGVTLINNTYNNTALNWNYTSGNQTIIDSILGASISGFEALETTSDYLPLIVLAVIIFLILTLIMGFGGLTGAGFGSGGRKPGGAVL